jgi:hypothetical protein
MAMWASWVLKLPFVVASCSNAALSLGGRGGGEFLYGGGEGLIVGRCWVRGIGVMKTGLACHGGHGILKLVLCSHADFEILVHLGIGLKGNLFTIG